MGRAVRSGMASPEAPIILLLSFIVGGCGAQARPPLVGMEGKEVLWCLGFFPEALWLFPGPGRGLDS